MRSLAGSLGIYLGESLGNSQFDLAPWRQLSGNFTSGWRQFAANVDGDGDSDIILSRLSGSSNSTVVLRSEGNQVWTQMGTASNTRVSNWSGYATLPADIDGLGATAMIWADTASTDNKISVGRWNGSGYDFLAVQSAQYRDTNDPPLSVRAADVDGDGDADLIWNSTTGTANRTYVSLGQGDGSFDFSALDQLHPDTEANWPQYTMYVADVNGDGRDDIIWNWAATTNRIYVAIGKK